MLAMQAHAQDLQLWQQGERFYQAGDFYTAAGYYERFLAAGQGSSLHKAAPFAVSRRHDHATPAFAEARKEAINRLAECYRLCNYPEKAEKWYQEAYSLRSDRHPYNAYWYGVMLRANQKIDEAAVVLRQFIVEYAQQDNWSASARRELDNISFIRHQLSQGRRYKVERTSSPGTYLTSMYAPVLLNDYTLIFTSTDSLTGAGTKGYFNRLYAAVIREEGLSGVSPVLPVNRKAVHEGMATFTPDGQAMYFTRWSGNAGKNEASIWKADRMDSGWSEPVKLTSPVNEDGYNSQQPFITQDGRYLVFASDRPGGYGKYDLWYISLATPGNRTAVNMGPSINTVEDEQAPFYNYHDRKLIFSSNGRIGMGGFDLYQSTGDFNEWSEPVNPGYPVNSARDDLYFFSASADTWEKAWISSDRFTDCCLELFSVSRIPAPVLLAGEVTDCSTRQALADARVLVADTNGMGTNITTVAGGRYIAALPAADWIKIDVAKDGYSSSTVMFPRPDIFMADTVTAVPVCLDRIGADIIYDQQPRPSLPLLVYFDFDKAIIPGTSHKVLDTIAERLKDDPALTLQLNGYTDHKGTTAYNLRLAERRARACARYLLSKGVRASQLQATAYGACCPIAEERTIEGHDDPAGRRLNRRVECYITEKKQ